MEKELLRHAICDKTLDSKYSKAEIHLCVDGGALNLPSTVSRIFQKVVFSLNLKEFALINGITD